MQLIEKLIGKIKSDKQILIKLLGTSITRGLGAFGTFLFNFVLAKYLGVEDLGHFMLGYTIIIGLGFIVRFGMGTAVLRFGGIMFANREIGKLTKLRSDVSLISFVVGAFFGLALIVLRKQIEFYFFDQKDVEKLLIILAFNLPILSFLIIQSNFIKAFKKPEISPFFESGFTVFFTSVLIVLHYWIFNYVNLLVVGWCLLISSTLVLIFGSLMLTKLLNKLKGNQSKRKEPYNNFYNSLPDYALSSIVGYLLKFSPIIFLGVFATGSDVGLFSIANSISFLINFILWIISAVYAPHFASLYEKKNIAKLESTVRSATLYMLVIAIPIFLVLVVFPTKVLSLFGDEFIDATVPLIILSCAQLFNVITGPVYFLLNMTGHEKYLRNIVLITALLSLLSCLILIPQYSYLGASIAVAIGLVLQNSLSYWITKKQLGISLL